MSNPASSPTATPIQDVNPERQNIADTAVGVSGVTPGKVIRVKRNTL